MAHKPAPLPLAAAWLSKAWKMRPSTPVLAVVVCGVRVLEPCVWMLCENKAARLCPLRSTNCCFVRGSTRAPTLAVKDASPSFQSCCSTLNEGCTAIVSHGCVPGLTSICLTWSSGIPDEPRALVYLQMHE